MDASLLELARARWLAAARAGILLDLGAEVIEAPREAVLFLRATGAPTAPAATPGPWTAVVGVVVDRGRTVRAIPMRTVRTLFGLEAIVGLTLED